MLLRLFHSALLLAPSTATLLLLLLLLLLLPELAISTPFIFNHPLLFSIHLLLAVATTIPIPIAVSINRGGRCWWDASDTSIAAGAP